MATTFEPLYLDLLKINAFGVRYNYFVIFNPYINPIFSRSLY